MYLGWFDDNPKKTTTLKIEEAIYAYVERFKTRPNVVLVNEADRAEIKGGEVDESVIEAAGLNPAFERGKDQRFRIDLVISGDLIVDEAGFESVAVINNRVADRIGGPYKIIGDEIAHPGRVENENPEIVTAD